MLTVPFGSLPGNWQEYIMRLEGIAGFYRVATPTALFAVLALVLLYRWRWMKRLAYREKISRQIVGRLEELRLVIGALVNTVPVTHEVLERMADAEPSRMLYANGVLLVRTSSSNGTLQGIFEEVRSGTAIALQISGRFTLPPSFDLREVPDSDFEAWLRDLPPKIRARG